MAKKYKVSVDNFGDTPEILKGDFSNVEIDDQALKVNGHEVIVPFERLVYFKTFENEDAEE